MFRLIKQKKIFVLALLPGINRMNTYRHQEGAEKGYNPIKKGANIYYPLLIFVSGLKLLFHIRFITGSASTSNGITEFL